MATSSQAMLCRTSDTKPTATSQFQESRSRESSILEAGHRNASEGFRLHEGLPVKIVTAVTAPLALAVARSVLLPAALPHAAGGRSALDNTRVCGLGLESWSSSKGASLYDLSACASLPCLHRGADHGGPGPRGGRQGERRTGAGVFEQKKAFREGVGTLRPRTRFCRASPLSREVVLKLCNRSRAAGVIVAPVDELDEVLEEILIPPEPPGG